MQRVPAPTRDIYVERKMDGDRVFAGFGRPSQEYCDCFLDPDKLPEDIIKVGGGRWAGVALSPMGWAGECCAPQVAAKVAMRVVAAMQHCPC